MKRIMKTIDSKTLSTVREYARRRPELLFLIFCVIFVAYQLLVPQPPTLQNRLNFLEGISFNSILPYTFFMSGFTVSAALILLTTTGVKWWRSSLIAFSLPVGSVNFYELVYQILRLASRGVMIPVLTWEDGTTSFLPWIIFAFVGIGFWKITVRFLYCVLSFTLLFLFWYFMGYPQISTNFEFSAAYGFNASTKVISFLIFLIPVVDHYVHTHNLTKTKLAAD